MGIFVSCCKGTSEELIPQPDAETRRRQQAEAAERRMQETEHRGIKDPESVRRLERKAEELERLEREQAMKGGAGAPLKVCTPGCLLSGKKSNKTYHSPTRKWQMN